MTSFGIDFGTSNCTVAAWDGRPTVLPLGLDRPTQWAFPGFELVYPSTFAIVDGQRRFGWAGKEALSDQEPVKRLLTGYERVILGGRTFSSRHVAALLFGALRERAAGNGVTIDSAVVTVPSNSNGMARYRTREAAGMAGIKVAALINEPTAAAMAYMQVVPDAERILVYDWGGGTIDVTILEFTNGIYQERVSRGIPGLGGIEVDKRLADLVRDRLPDNVVLDGRAGLEFRAELERVKIALSFVEDPDDAVAFRLPTGHRTELTRRDMESSIDFLIESTLKPVRACLDAVNLEAVDLDAVIMVGGSSYIPAVRTRLTEFLGTEPVSQEVINPLTIVAEGAALAAAAINGDTDVVFSVISNHALATRVKDKAHHESLSEVIPQGVELPYSASKRYTPNGTNATKIKVQVWEGDVHLPIDDPENVLLAELPFPLAPGEDPRDREFELEYRYDVDGVLHVTATQVRTGRILLKDKVDFFSASAADIDPEIRDVEATFPEPAELIRKVKSRRVEPVRQERTGPVLVVDGSNLACEGRDIRGGAAPSYAQLLNARARLAEIYPGSRILTVVDANLVHKLELSERALLEDDLAAGLIARPPAGTIGRGDALVLQIAKDREAIVVSNDSFREHQADHPWLLESNRVIGGTPVQDSWYFVPRTPRRPAPGWIPTPRPTPEDAVTATRA